LGGKKHRNSRGEGGKKHGKSKGLWGKKHGRAGKGGNITMDEQALHAEL